MKSATIRTFYYLTCILGFSLPADRVFGQIYHVQEMNTEQIKALDREKTAVLLPVGILEEHGPYLPSGSDVYITDRR
ncbi:MAG TPA: creatininase family protein, partial [Candidatus Binatia bacterium]